MAMADAGNQVEGCTAYVTLEPAPITAVRAPAVRP